MRWSSVSRRLSGIGRDSLLARQRDCALLLRARAGRRALEGAGELIVGGDGEREDRDDVARGDGPGHPVAVDRPLQLPAADAAAWRAHAPVTVAPLCTRSAVTGTEIPIEVARPGS